MTYESDFITAFRSKNSIDFGYILTHPEKGTGYSGRIKNENLANLFQVTVKPFNTVEEAFANANEQLRLLNRVAESQTKWIVEPLYQVCKQLFSIATTLDATYTSKSNETQRVGDLHQESFLEKSVRTIHNSFKLCLNDRNPELSEARTCGVFHFVNLEYEIYSTLQNKDLMRNLQKVIISKMEDLPNLDRVVKSQAVKFCYYNGVLFGSEGDYSKAYEWLQRALNFCRYRNDKKIKEKILVMLLPYKFLYCKIMPGPQLWKLYPEVKALYFEMFESLKSGDLKRFDQWFESHEMFFLKKKLYLSMELIREFVLLKLVKRSYLMMDSQPHVSIKQVAKCLNVSMFRSTESVEIDEVECLLVNLISKGYIKGYLSHGKCVMVLSKTNPFPRLAMRA